MQLSINYVCLIMQHVHNLENYNIISKIFSKHSKHTANSSSHHPWPKTHIYENRSSSRSPQTYTSGPVSPLSWA